MRHTSALILIALAGTGAAQSPFQSGEIEWNGKPAPRGSTLLRTAMLAEHNAARRDYGSKPLVWDETLARDAERYAKILAARGEMAHDPQTGVKPKQGENLFMGTRSAYAYAAMARLWVDEKKDFKKGVFPNVVKSGPWSLVGHYTQIVWPTSERFGCAVASNREDDVLVCRYLPAGNYFGTPMR